MRRVLEVLHPDWMSRDVTLLIVARAFMSSGRALSAVLLPIYLTLIGFSASQLGFLIALVAISSAVMTAAVGLLSDRLGRKLFVVAVPLLAAVAAAAFTMSRLEVVLFVAAAAGSFGRGSGAGAGQVGPYAPAEQALIADATPAQQRNAVFGRVAFASAVGGLIGGLLAVIPQLLMIAGLARTDAYQRTFLVVAVLAACASVVVIPIANPRAETPNARLFSLPRRSWGLLSRLWVTNSINGLAVGFFGPFVTYWFFRRYGAGSDTIGILYALINLATMLSNLGAAPVARRLGLVRAVVITRIVSAVLLVAMALAPAFWIAGAVYLIRMMAQRVSLPLRQSYVMGMADPSERAAVAGLSNLPAQATSTLSPILAGYIFENVSLALPFELGAIFQTLNGIAYLAFFHNARPPEERAAGGERREAHVD